MLARRRSVPAVSALAAVLALAGIVAVGDPQAAAPFVPHGGALSVAAAHWAFHAPRVAMDSANRILVVWAEAAGPEDEPRWRARRFDAAGVALSAAIDLAGPGVAEPLVGGVSDLAMTPDGRWAIAWAEGDAVFVRRFSPAGEPEGPAVRVDTGEAQQLVGVERPTVALADDGSGLVLWVQRLRDDYFDPFEVFHLVSRRVGAGGQPLGDEVPRAGWAPQGFGFLGTWDADFNAAGDAVLATVHLGGDPSAVYLEAVLLPAGGGTVPLAAPLGDDGAALHPSEDNPRVAADGAGSFAVAFDDTSGQGPDSADGSCSGVYVGFYAADGTPLAPERRVHRETLGCQGLVDVAGLAGGGWLVAWTGAFPIPHLGFDSSREGLWLTTYDANGDEVGAPVRLLRGGFDFRALPALAAGDARAVVADARGGPWLHLLAPAGSAACPPPAPAGPLCLGGGRWRIDTTWRDPYNRGSGYASPRPLVADTGAVWFFEPGNLELLVKVLDGRPVNGHWWVFYGALSTVEYHLDVIDLATGRQTWYWNPPFVQASRADTVAFAGEAAPARAPSAAPRPAPAPARGVDLAPAAPPPPAAVAEEPTRPCAAAPDRLCLHGRFAVEVAWRDPRSGDTGDGQAVPIDGPSGAFWFFHPDNLELLVKVLDGRTVNGHWWVFHGGLSDVEYTITVTDTAGGTTATYRNPAFGLSGGADTAAFAEGP